MRNILLHLSEKIKKKSLTTCILGLAFAINWQIAFCQNGLKTPVIPPSPTSAVFTRYGVDQPSLQTGTVNIPISLFNIQAKGIEIPLTITYQTSGINIADSPYPVGYGWVFSSGFRISRVILGRPDERFPFKQEVTADDYEVLKPGIIGEDIYNLHGLNQADLFDTQKDIFTLSLPSGSYNFFLKKNGSGYDIISIGHQIKIEVLSGFTGFKVTDSNGVIYMFGYDANTSFADFTEPSSVGGNSAWMLREIVLLNGEKLKFSWQKVNVNAYAVRTNASISVLDHKDYDCSVPTFEVNDPGGIIDYSSYSGANSLMLKKIEYPSGIVELSYKSYQDPFLQSVVVKNLNYEVIKTINFSYGVNNSANDHLLLQTINVNGEIYSFQYNANRFYQQTTGLDYWGFYNGKVNNLSLIPSMSLKVYTGLNQIYSWPISYTPVGNADRSVSPEHMKAYMLTKMTYPTGGYSEYEYEPHEFIGQTIQSLGIFQQDPAPLTLGGGLRVKEIRSYASSTDSPIIKTYKYGPNENGMANVPVAPTLDTFIDEFLYANEPEYLCAGNPPFSWPTYRQMNINALSNYSKFLISKNPIWYSNVVEYLNSEVKTDFTFSLDETYLISWQLNAMEVKSPYSYSYDNLFNKGPKLIDKIEYRKIGPTYLPIRKTTNEYEVYQNLNDNISNIIIDRKAIFLDNTSPGPDLYPPSYYPSGLGLTFPGSYNYLRLPYGISVRYDRLKKVKTIQYEGADSLASYEEYFYNDPQIIKVVRNSSIAGKDISVQYKYPNDFTDVVYQQMATKNIVSPVIEETTSKGNTVIKRLKTNYSDNLAITNGLFLPVSIETAYTPSGPFTTETLFEKYDPKGNIQQTRKLEGPKDIYVWGYNGQYPIAQVKGAELNEISIADPSGFSTFFYGNIESPVDFYYSDDLTAPLPCPVLDLSSQIGVMTTYGMNFQANKTYVLSYWEKEGTLGLYGSNLNIISNQVLKTKGDWKLRQTEFTYAGSQPLQINFDQFGLLQDLKIYPKDAEITTYTYKPLVGMTSQTDVKGMTTFYEYDALQRLKFIKDQNYNVIKSFDYHYKN